MSTTREAAVAGQFYPEESHQLQQMVSDMLDQVDLAESDQGSTLPPKAIIAPHAGYIYSGPIAASVYQRLRSAASTIQRVILLGPSHRVAFSGLATSSADAYRTPLGIIPIDQTAIKALSDLCFVHLLDQAHRQEHSLEVHLPFLQTVLGSFKLVPLVVGDATAEEVGEVLERLWGGEETLIVISSDLSHYHDYLTARRMDQATSQAIEALQWQQIHPEGACGRIPISGLLYAARHHNLTARTIDLRNSGDTAGTKDQVVGYGAYVFE